ncbi:DUF456 domain-containing protein [Planococcus salinus]|uniref:Uncharacterized protein n=1 Tax=Planococcus salinus TaxID=1848460 RepID=A0A3M8PBZ4_9BACL|nr:DUF456 domain-containing protein [Planococcus salinus]RNF41227.1 hypothetical protein EEX84_02455 [Planococcus salinus]
MTVLYVAVGGILGLIFLGPLGVFFGVALGLIFGVANAAENKAIKLESRMQKMEFKFNDEIVSLKETIKELEKNQKE